MHDRNRESLHHIFLKCHVHFSQTMVWFLLYANIIQAVVFWLIHVPGYVYLWQIFDSGLTLMLVVVIALATPAVSFFFGWLRIRDKNRSLVAPVVMHTLANGITYSVVMFIS